MLVCIMFRLDLNMELPQGQTGSVGTSVASAEQVHLHTHLGIDQRQYWYKSLNLKHKPDCL